REDTMTRLLADGSPPAEPASRTPSKAFTLVEILVVVLILATLMAVALPLYLAAVSNSARRTARADLHTLVTAEQAYRLEHQSYTEKLDDLCPKDGGPDPSKVLSICPKGPGNANYTLHLGGETLPSPDKRTVPDGGVAACAEDSSGGVDKYGCFIPGQDN